MGGIHQRGIALRIGKGVTVDVDRHLDAAMPEPSREALGVHPLLDPRARTDVTQGADAIARRPHRITLVIQLGLGLALDHDGTRFLSDGSIARQNDIALRTTVETASIAPNLPEIVHPLLAPLYGLFDFFDLPMTLVSDELAKMRRGNF